ncbi:MAG: efflux transporter outer membrane subunit [Desulfobacterium sp.]|jgi:NodT family efflux transporter outer membrane factor (OMF) lipoprotein|nr:efflux transporter outer membrane subunit [Desulfobacterium sp.]MDY0376322.1 efflux transporter outer membrane subunit [Desulfobacterium sp.]
MRKIILNIVVILSLSACTLTPDYVRPNIETPITWDGDDIEDSADIAYTWWESFGDETLNDLMAKALSNNTDITAGVQVVNQSRAAFKIAGADLWPSLSGSAGGSNTYTNPESASSFESKRFSAGLSASYELDLFGANRANKNAAQADLLSSIYGQDALKLVVMGDVAQTYFTLLNLRERKKIADKNLESRREVLRIIQIRVNEGADSDLELSQQKSLVASAEASRTQIIELTKNAKNALAVLLGRLPQGFDVQTVSIDTIKMPDIAVGQPSELLERRPDLKAAEADLLVANANIGAAKAAFYPSISLGMDDTFSIAGFSDPSTSILTLASNITSPIFQGGRLEGGLEQATAKQLELAENYRGAVYTAFQDVEDALAAVQSAQSRELFLKTVMDQSRRAYALSKESYDAGAIDFQTLLDTQISLLSAEDTYAQARLAKITAAVGLYKAMGGGWEN